jgi:hypothetical protein
VQTEPTTFRQGQVAVELVKQGSAKAANIPCSIGNLEGKLHRFAYDEAMQFTIRGLMLFTTCAAGVALSATQWPPFYLNVWASARVRDYYANPKFWGAAFGEFVGAMGWLYFKLIRMR